ncbi:MAG: PilZ domain-containing protein [Nitrospinales bacterium]
MSANLESKRHEKTETKQGTPWFKKFFGWGSRKSNVDLGVKEKRNSYRLKLTERDPIVASIFPEENGSFNQSLHDLSAEGFSCRYKTRHEFKKGDSVKVKFQLPMDDSQPILTEAIFINVNVNLTRKTKVYGFRFTENFPEKIKDQIHLFVMNKQIESIRDGVPLVAV